MSSLVPPETSCLSDITIRAQANTHITLLAASPGSLLCGRTAIDFSSCSQGNSQVESDFLLSSSAGVCLAKGLIFKRKFYQFSLSCIIKDTQPPIVWKIL